MTPDRIESALAGFRAARIAVVGDLMLDEYVWGDVARISPDAPVQVVEIRRRSHAVGGAGNVAVNLAAAGASVILAGVVGEDGPGRTLSRLLEESGVEGSGVTAETGRPTTVKTRVIARGQHVVRLDDEVRVPLGPATRRRMLEALEKSLPECRAVLVSDYAKGVVDGGLVADLISLARRAKGGEIPVVVDPKSSDLSRYSGAAAITPNLREAELAARMSIRSDEEMKEAGRRMREACGAPWILITRGEKGMALCGPDGSLSLITARAREVYDVTGAGDTVLAYFSLGLATGVPPGEAAEIANLAAGVKIGKVGTAAVAPSELILSQQDARGSRKIVSLREAATLVEHERSQGRTIVFTNGCFDLLHAGHIALLERARALGSFLVVAVNSDASVRRLKGEGRPLVSENDRVRILAALDAVDLVVVFGEDTPMEAIEQVRPDVLVKGGDYSTETIVGHELVLGYGGRVETVPLVGGRSTSGLIEAIRRGSET